jgi:hypothetical protein
LAAFTGAGCASLPINTLRFSRVRFRASFNSRVFGFLLARRHFSHGVSGHCSREHMSILLQLSALGQGPGSLTRFGHYFI